MTVRKKGECVLSQVASSAERIIREVMIEQGLKKPDARRVLAREIGVAPGAIERLCNGTLVHFERVADRLNAYMVRRIERQIARLEGELVIARLAARRPDEVDLAKAEAALEDAKRAIGAL